MGNHRLIDQVCTLYFGKDGLYIAKLDKIYVKEIVRFHRVIISILSDRGNSLPPTFGISFS